MTSAIKEKGALVKSNMVREYIVIKGSFDVILKTCESREEALKELGYWKEPQRSQIRIYERCVLTSYTDWAKVILDDEDSQETSKSIV